MSREVGLSFSFATEVMISSVVEKCGWLGWRPLDQGKVRYLVDPDLSDWSTDTVENLARVMSRMEECEAVRSSSAIIMTWMSSGVGGSFLFDPSRRELDFLPIVNKVTREDFSNYLDVSWYLDRLIPPLHVLGLSGFTITDIHP